MDVGLLDVLACPQCGEHPLEFASLDGDGARDLVNGVVWSPACGTWYPVEDELLELLPNALAYADERAHFWTRYEARLRALGLRPFTADAGQADVHEQQHQQQHFDWYADNPQQTYSTYEQMPFWQAADAVVFDEWAKKIRPGRRLLDVGCAQGRSTFKVIDLDIDIVAFDISRALIRQAIDRNKRDRPRARATFFVADASRLPFVDEAFDYVLIYGVLHHLPDPATTCREVSRVLKAGGFYFCSENNRTVFRAGFDLLQRLRPMWYEEAGEHAQISRQDLDQWLRPAGFRSSVRTSVFLPPHLLNHLSPKLGKRLLTATDRFWNAIPILRDQGGLIMATCVKTRTSGS